MSVWEDLTVCDFLDIIDSWKLVGWGKMGFKAQTCWTDLLAFCGVWNRSRILNFGPDRLFFWFSRALVHTIEVFSPSEWGPDPQCQATQVDHWTWWWQCLAAWHCRSIWSLPCHFAADAGGLALSMVKSRWHGALRSAHKSCTHGHVFYRGGMKRGLVADPWTSSRRFSHMLWLKVHSHLLLRACLLGSKRKLPPQACQIGSGLPSVVCHIRGVQFPGTVYIYSQGPFSSAWAHCISCAPSACSHCRRCCCCPLQCDRQRMETRLNSAGGPVPTADHDLSLSCIYSQSFLLHCFFPSQEPPDTFLKWFSNDNKVIGKEVLPGDPRAELSW